MARAIDACRFLLIALQIQLVLSSLYIGCGSGSPTLTFLLLQATQPSRDLRCERRPMASDDIFPLRNHEPPLAQNLQAVKRSMITRPS